MLDSVEIGDHIWLFKGYDDEVVDGLVIHNSRIGANITCSSRNLLFDIVCWDRNILGYV